MLSTNLQRIAALLFGTWMAVTFSGMAFTPAFGATIVPTPEAIIWPSLSLTTYITGTTSPVFVTHSGDSSGRLFVVERAGRVKIFKNGVYVSTFLDISSIVDSQSYEERGLLSIAFSPKYATTGRFYVYYTDLNGSLIVARYFASPISNVADSAHSRIVLTIPHPTYANHNGGQLQFGPNDGYLYLGPGDGGSGGDPSNNAQSPNVLLGKILRIDVESGNASTYTNPFTYTIPSSNPYSQTLGYLPEIWGLGVRNPWRFSFDRANGDLYIGDVGQNCFEEVDYQPGSSTGGQNYGWRQEEGIYLFNPIAPSDCTQPISPLITTTKPITSYAHAVPPPNNCAIIGGYVYRGPSYYRLFGTYFYGDECSGRIWGLRKDGSSWTAIGLITAAPRISTFGEDQIGNVYVANIDTGSIYRLQGEAFSFLPLVFRVSH